VLTKAIIQSIDYTKNTCRVRIPLFENASRNINMIEADAQLNIVPGIYNSYKTGDIVFIGFEENKMELPVILGKLFVTASAEASSYRGSVSGNSLAITDTAQLPYSTVFNYDKIAQNNTIYKDLNTPKKLADGIINLQRSQVQKYQTIIKILVDETPYSLYLKTSNDFTYTPDKSDEPLYRLCTALKNSQPDNTFIPLDLVVVNDTVISLVPSVLQVQEMSSTGIRLKLLINGSGYEVIKDSNVSRNDFLEVQSFAIYY
jgi:hypothetical protein